MLGLKKDIYIIILSTIKKIAWVFTWYYHHTNTDVDAEVHLLIQKQIHTMLLSLLWYFCEVGHYKSVGGISLVTREYGLHMRRKNIVSDKTHTSVLNILILKF